jgi:hypothetical protein
VTHLSVLPRPVTKSQLLSLLSVTEMAPDRSYEAETF